MKKYLLPQAGTFYKANLHCHSDFSDARLSPAELKKLYREQGYSIIAFTDHDILLPHPELRDEHFLPLNGYEMEINSAAADDGGPCCHMCLIALEEENLTPVCWHRSKYLFANAVKHRAEVRFNEAEPDYVREYSPEGISDMMKLGREAGFFVTYNHPTWSQEDYRAYAGYEGMHAMEICNFGCIAAGYEDYNPRVYDDMLRAGKRIYCIAADDNHNHGTPCTRDSFGGFVMIKARELEYRTVTRALEEGHFYASQGPEIHELWFEEGRIHITCSPAVKIGFTLGRRRGYCVFSAPEGQTITEASLAVEPGDVYVRVTVTDGRGRHADTNAYFTDELFAK